MPIKAPGYVKKEFLGVSLKKLTIEKLKEISEQEDVPLSRLVERFIQEGLRSYIPPAKAKTLLNVKKFKKEL